MTTAEQPSVFTATSALSLAGVASIGVVAYYASHAFLPKNAKGQERYTFIWLVFDALIRFTFEGSFLWLSTFGRQVNTSSGAFAEMWKEYALADYRWGISDPTIVSLEILTVLGTCVLSCYILMLLANDDPTRHYWLIVLSTSELYGGWMIFCPEWLTGSLNLNTSNALYLWVYLVLMNSIWVVIPLWIMFDSYTHIAGALRAKQATTKPKSA